KDPSPPTPLPEAERGESGRVLFRGPAESWPAPCPVPPLGFGEGALSGAGGGGRGSKRAYACGADPTRGTGPLRGPSAARWPVGGIRTHLGYNAPTLAAAGWRCTFVVPQDETLPALKDTLGDLPGSEFIGVPLNSRESPLWKAIRPLLLGRRFSLLHAH